MSAKFKSLLALSSTTLLLAACQGQDAGSNSASNGSTDQSTQETSSHESGFAIAMVTDEGGIDDRSFNQSAWEGMQEWASAEEGRKAEYYQSEDQSDFIPNFNTALTDGYDVIYGIGYLLEDAVTQVAEQNPEQYFGIVDAVVDLDNVVSLTFSDHEAAFLAGVAAATETESNHVGFVGGITGPIIDRFQTGFEAGVEYVNPSIEVDVDYAESFSDAALGQQIASAMFTNGADVVYHAAGAVGNGVFTEARNRMEASPEEQIWVIGVDRDQEAEGEWSGGNLTLASTLKNVGNAVQLASNEAEEGNFPGGENVQYGLEEGGVDLSEGNLSDEALQAVNEAREGIIEGSIEVPEFSNTEAE